MTSKIISVATVTPKYRYSSDEINTYVKKWISDQSIDIQNKILMIFNGAGIDYKYSVLPIEQVFSAFTLEEKNNIYKKAVIELACEVFQNAINRADISTLDIDYIITTSCTGYMIPSLDAYLINRFKFKKDVQRLPVTEMGCAGGSAGLIYADHFLRAYPDKKAALICVEAPSVTFQNHDYSMDNIVGAALFSDGAACAILGSSKQCVPEIIDTNMYNFSDTTEILGFNLTNSGFKMILKPELPYKIIKHFNQIFNPLLERNNLSIENINHFILHPGGKKITDKISEILGKYDKNLSETKEIMKLYGNMSSPTILFVLERCMNKDIQKGDFGLMLGFGPGFVSNSLLLKW